MPQATEKAQNGPDQWLATTGLSTPQGFIASPLHRVVITALFSQVGVLDTNATLPSLST